MSIFGTLFALVNALAILLLPRRWALAPILIGGCYMTLGQGIALGPFHFTVIRLLVLAGAVRIIMRREFPMGGLVAMDWFAVAWAAWAVFSSFFHQSPAEALIFRLGVVFNALGIYFLVRGLCHDLEDAIRLAGMTAVLLGPIAVEMMIEQQTGRNLFSILGGVLPDVTVRDGKLRANGPFAHPILAGTVGAVSFPLMLGLRKLLPRAALIGIASCGIMTLASRSSGPLMSLIFSLAALCWWRWRHLNRQLRIGAVVAYILLDIVMKSPAYYLIARIDLTGSSTGWHRAALMEASVKHLDEWWFAGTDVTRHWMPTGVRWNLDHTDITNHFIQQGVWGGLPMMLLLIWMIVLGFSYVGNSVEKGEAESGEDPRSFFVWSLGASLFANAASCISVSYFDQSYMFLYLNLGSIASVWAASSHDVTMDGAAHDKENDIPIGTTGSYS